MHAHFSGHNPGLDGMVKATMKRWWTWVWAVVAGGLLVVAVLAAAMAWRLHALPAAHAQNLMRSLNAEHDAMWASVWGPSPTAANGQLTHGALGWTLWPRPQIHLSDVRWTVPVELSSDGEWHIERLSLALTWSSLWADTPRVHDVRVAGLTGASRHTRWGLQGRWRVRQAWLGPADEAGTRGLAWTLDASLRSLRAGGDNASAEAAQPWLDGRWQGHARWHPARAGEAAHWRTVELRFAGQVAGQAVPDARLRLARWLHLAEQQQLAWEGLELRAQVGEAAQAAQLELQSAVLDVGPDAASGTGLSGSWQTAAPQSLTWQLQSAAPRGRYSVVSWPKWRALLSGRDGTRAGGQLQADLSWLPDRRALRWDALLGEVSVQPRGEAERQWSLRGQLELGLRSTSWQLEGQAYGGAPDAVLWDGPFATDGEWRRWPDTPGQPQTEVRLRVASLWLDRWGAASQSALWPARWLQQAAWPDRLELHVGQLGWKGVRLTSAEAQLGHQNGVLRLAALNARLWDGQLRASGEWQLATGHWQLAARARDAELALLRQTLDDRARGAASAPRQLAAAQGRWNGTLALSGRQWVASEWQGQWAVDARAGHWQGLDLHAARQAASADARTPDPSARTDWRRLQAAGTVAGGVAHIDRLQLSNAGWRMAADGTIDLQDGTLALAWSDLVGSRKRGPVLSLTGPWRTPSTRSP